MKFTVADLYDDDDFFNSRKKTTPPSLYEWLSYYSTSIWKRLHLTSQKGFLKTYETTITQNFLHDLWYFLYGAISVPIWMFEAKSERVNGNDIEIFVKFEDGYLFFPCQAKIIWQNNKYPKLKHEVANVPQIRSLRSYADKKGGLPIYFLYNYCSNQEWNQTVQQQIDFDIELYGCSMVNADLIYSSFCKLDDSNKLQWTIPSFKDLHPNLAVPCSLLGKAQKEKLNMHDFMLALDGAKSNRDLTVYTKEEVFNDDAWNDISGAKMPFIGSPFTNFDIIRKANFDTSYPDFRPKFRIVIASQGDLPIYNTTIVEVK